MDNCGKRIRYRDGYDFGSSFSVGVKSFGLNDFSTHLISRNGTPAIPEVYQEDYGQHNIRLDILNDHGRQKEENRMP